MKIHRIVALVLVALVALAGVARAQFTEQRVWGGTSGGSANAHTLTISNMGTTVPVGVPFRFIAGFTNTSTATLTISGGSAAAAIYKPTAAGPSALSGGEIIAGQIVEVINNGTQYQIVSNTDAAAAQVKISPQGYLTPCPAASPPTGCTAGIVAPTGDVTVGVGQPVTGMVYVPVTGNQIPIYNGSNMVVTAFAELTLTLASSHIAGTAYDVCVFNDSGTVRLGTGPAWSNSGAGAGDRGTGAATAQIARVQGLWTNAVAITATNGASTYAVAANGCTIVGSILVSGSNGVLMYTRTWGQNRVWPTWNFYNRLPVVLLAGDSTASWAYGTATVRASNGTSANRASVFTGLAEDQIIAVFEQNLFSNSSALMTNGIGWNSTTAFSGKQGFWNIASSGTAISSHINAPALGLNNVQQLELGASGTQTWSGTNPNMQMRVEYRG